MGEKPGERQVTRSRRTTSGDPWSCLHVIQKLEVGPVRIESKRLVVPYRIVQDGRVDRMDLVYRYEEAVYDPADPGAEDLARMQAVHIAFNYGLFCDEIVFHGDYDEHDRRFIEQMIENTSREIAVKKFLEPNPFLRGPAAALRTTALDVPHPERWTHARLRFVPGTALDAALQPVLESASGRVDGSAPEPVIDVARGLAPEERGGPATGAARHSWSTDPTRYAVLSSGGKDSLLSFGLLREAGLEVHPIFVNESGNHWLTALNAYRHLAAHHPGTARVWTNSDRLFAWFKRHMPFIRPDFLEVRADDYPIRLWTVAVFLFGALPLLRARSIGRLVIGDEFDTTRRGSHQGIPHYDGLYDQSRYFDRALTRYFQRKGWGVQQFSMLRPLSEFLIQKSLAVRYPDLLVHQVSCHAAHTESDGRVHPCGRCEKCRRIVGMLVALDVDPALCGYSSQQVRACLQALATSGVHQEAECAAHVGYLLARKGMLAVPPGEGPVRSGGVAIREHPEVMKLRFDRERAPLEDIPEDLREALLRIFLQHADGAVQRVGRAWVELGGPQAIALSAHPVVVGF